MKKIKVPDPIKKGAEIGAGIGVGYVISMTIGSIFDDIHRWICQRKQNKARLGRLEGDMSEMDREYREELAKVNRMLTECYRRIEEIDSKTMGTTKNDGS